MSEDYITNTIVKRPQPFGYGDDPLHVKAFKWGDAGGTSDLVMFPNSGPLIAIFEVKKASNDEANAMVLGQLLKYYARALRTGAEGIQAVKTALSTRRQYQATSAAQLFNCSEVEANRRCRAGRRLEPTDIHLHIVVDDAPERMELRLARTCRILKRHHGLEIRLWRLNAGKNGIEPLPSPRTDDEGRAYAGSQRQIQIYVNRHQEKLNSAIVAAVPELRDSTIEWVCPLVTSDCKEYRDAEALQVLGYPGLVKQLASFWPRRGPQWDALAKMKLADGKSGVLLLEAKSHVDEIESPATAAKDEGSLAKIRAAFGATKKWLSVDSSVDWTKIYYQIANRLAALCFLRRASVPTWLVSLYFLDDPSPRRATSRGAWIAKIADVNRQMGLTDVEIPGHANVFLESLDEPWATS